ncbi:MAG TPA: hypothetical protein VK174_09340, partial [Chitinophagales bacterium]|nr:hypothetical protein [Chitinophagales bacterium]
FGAVKNDTVINFERDFAKSEKLIKARLKANIGRNLFDTGMFYRVINATVNNVFAKAVEVMTNNSKFNVLKPKEEKTGPDKVKTGKEKGKKKIKIVTNEKTK